MKMPTHPNLLTPAHAGTRHRNLLKLTIRTLTDARHRCGAATAICLKDVLSRLPATNECLLDTCSISKDAMLKIRGS